MRKTTRHPRAVPRASAERSKQAERRAGILLKEMAEAATREQRGGDRKSKSPVSTLIEAPKLADFGITRNQSSKWQKLADIPEADFEEAHRIRERARVMR
jgi:hypothetical protein